LYIITGTVEDETPRTPVQHKPLAGQRVSIVLFTTFPFIYTCSLYVDFIE